MREIKKAIRKTILPEQRGYVAGIDWLVNDGPRGSGRTHILALAFIKKALQCGHPIKVWDHYEYHGRKDIRHILEAIDKAVWMINETLSGGMQLDLRVVPSIPTIQITYTTKMDKELLEKWVARY